ncbi:hypothetical protein [Burkholderia cepacia]|uniref:hypothetical protein n=1 Tax=Burkholderia cepacia TaxID=292 RepID=UPI0012D93B76|nr:hypothetical protein [Burkholderia cepacia]
MYRIREAGQLEPITALGRTFPDGISEQSGVVTSSAHAMPASKAGDDETGPRSTCYKRPSGSTGRHCRLLERPVQPLAKQTNLFAGHQRGRIALSECERPYQEHNFASKIV